MIYLDNIIDTHYNYNVMFLFIIIIMKQNIMILPLIILHVLSFPCLLSYPLPFPLPTSTAW